jgi:hypothetical protein
MRGDEKHETRTLNFDYAKTYILFETTATQYSLTSNSSSSAYCKSWTYATTSTGKEQRKTQRNSTNQTQQLSNIWLDVWVQKGYHCTWLSITLFHALGVIFVGA